MGYVDFHTHILPELDDGSKNAKMSVEMLKALRMQGVETVVATPHFYPDRIDPKSFLARRKDSIDSLMREFGESGPEVPRLCVGAEVAYFDGMSGSDAVNGLCIEGTKVLLLEMPFCPWGKSELKEVSGVVDRLRITPVIAHVDRYVKYQKKDVLREMLRTGAILQCNAEAFLNIFSRGFALKTVADGGIIGSDCHDMTRRAPNLKAAADMIEKKLGRETVDEIAARSRYLLEGAERFI
jgi:protein-tyrosine phosphatase